jgi:hypothetical protein
MSQIMSTANKRNERCGAAVLLEVLRSEGVQYAFGNPGTTELPLIDALVDAPGPKSPKPCCTRGERFRITRLLLHQRNRPITQKSPSFSTRIA